MGLTNFPNGVTSYGIPIVGGGSSIPSSNGTYFFVSSVAGSSSNTGVDMNFPYSTVAAAITASTTGDVIVMLPGHTETISTAGGWTPKAGTSIVGLGFGSNRPKITFSAAAATILVSAASVYFNNFVVTSGITELVTIFSVSGVECIINAVDYMETTAVSCITFMTTTAAAKRWEVINCRHNSTTIPTATAAWLSIVGGDGWTIANNIINVNRANNAVSAIIGSLTPAATNIAITNNLMSQGTSGTSKIPVSLFAGTTGIVADNRAFCLGSTAIAGSFAIANCAAFQNFAVHTVNKSGLLDPIADT